MFTGINMDVMKKMNQIKFAHNFNNKLDGQIFSTIRARTDKKAEYYMQAKGDEYQVMLKGKEHCKARLFEVVVYRSLRVVPFGILMLDTGFSDLNVIYKLFEKFGVTKKHTPVLVLWFEKIKQ